MGTLVVSVYTDLWKLGGGEKKGAMGEVERPRHRLTYKVSLNNVVNNINLLVASCPLFLHFTDFCGFGLYGIG